MLYLLKTMTSMATDAPRPRQRPTLERRGHVGIARPATNAKELNQLCPSSPLVPRQNLAAGPRSGINELVHGDRTIGEIGRRQVRD